MKRRARALFALPPLVALATAVLVVDLPLYSIEPGEVREVVPLVEVRGLRTYQPRGRLLMTTVSLGRLTPVEAIDAWLDDSREVVPEREVLDRGETDRDYRRTSRSQMDQSKLSAAAFAIDLLTPYPQTNGRGVLVHDVIEGSASDGVLVPGDRIVGVAGERVDGIDDMERVLDEVRRRAVRLDLRVDGERETVTVRPRPVEPGGAPVLGIVALEAFPYGVAIDSDDTGGPSAGLMYALALIDVLTPGDLTAGRTVAGTGAVDPEGSVRGVGGVPLKIRAAERAGADVFLVPKDNLEEARAARPEVRLVAVESVEDAIRALERGAA